MMWIKIKTLYGEGMTAANSLPGENQSFADRSLRFVQRCLMPSVSFSCTLVLAPVPAGGDRGGDGAGDAKQESVGG